MDKKQILEDMFGNDVRNGVSKRIKTIYEWCTLEHSLFYTLLFDKTPEKTFEYGKMFRTYLVKLARSAAGLWIGVNDISVKLPEVVELIHQSTLPIDDIQDNSEMRCWRQALWKIVGKDEATLTGFLLMWSWGTQYANILWEDKDGILYNYSYFLQKTLTNLICWQLLDLKANETWKTIEDYFKIVDGKTWALINLALHFWTMPYEWLYTEEKSEMLTKFSMSFARLYQIYDDIDDIKKWKELDPSNIYYYADIAKHPENLGKIYLELHDELKEAHDKLLKLWVLKENYLIDLANVLLPKEVFELPKSDIK